jgi:hypothetical protein
MKHRARRLAAPAWAAAWLTLIAEVAAADTRPLDAADLERLQRGETVVREQTLSSDGDDDRRFVGGLAYAVLDAAPEDVGALFSDAAAYTQLLPRTRSAVRISGTAGDQRIQLIQGTALVSLSYVVHVRDYPRESTVRFWLDAGYPHGIEDAWGFVRAERWPAAAGRTKTLVSYGVLVELGPGIVRAMYEDKLRAAMLSVPSRLRSYVAAGSKEATPATPR